MLIVGFYVGISKSPFFEDSLTLQISSPQNVAVKSLWWLNSYYQLNLLLSSIHQLSLDMDIENTSRSSSSTFQGPEKMGRDEASTITTKEDEQMITTHKEKQDSPTDQVC